MVSHTRFITVGRGLTARRSAALLLALALAGALMCAVRGQDVAAVASGQAAEKAAGAAIGTGATIGVVGTDVTPDSTAAATAPGPKLLPPLRTSLPRTAKARAALAASQAAAFQASAAALSAAGVVSASAVSAAFQPVLDLHNTLRARHQSPALVWDATVAATAQAYANRCLWAHNPDLRRLGLGENLALGYPSLTAAVQAWYDEARFYNYNRPGFSSATGHFTALVWKSTTKLGCGSARCSSLSNRVILVCNYQPAGNIVNAGFFVANVLRPVSGH